MPGLRGFIFGRFYLAERALTDSAGLPRRPWFENRIYAPGYYPGYGGKTPPGIRGTGEQRKVAETEAKGGREDGAIDRMGSPGRKGGGGLGGTERSPLAACREVRG